MSSGLSSCPCVVRHERLDYAGPFTERDLLGNLSQSAGGELLRDSKNVTVTKNRAANKCVKMEYRRGLQLQLVESNALWDS